MPYINSKFIAPVLYVVGLIVLWNNFLGLFHYNGDWIEFREKLPFFLFVILATILAILSFIENLSLIPVLGLASCFYLMTELGYTNWLRFVIWLVIGLVIYFMYSRHNSNLAKQNT
jgi:hypothetical protein